MSLSHSIHLRPTGPDDTYRRLDYVRGFVLCVLVAAFFLVSAVAISSRQLFGGASDTALFPLALLALVSLAGALLFAVNALLGSISPADFATAPDFVPLNYRAPIREIMVSDWDPQRRGVETSSPNAYDAYLARFYEMGRERATTEDIVNSLEYFETSGALDPGSDPSRRLRAAERLREIFS